MVAGGHAWLLGGACVGYDEIRSMSGRYAYYWNAFLCSVYILKDLFILTNRDVSLQRGFRSVSTNH